MKQKIKQLTVVSGPGVKFYTVGKEHDGIEIAGIIETSLEYPDAFVSMHEVKSADGQIIAEIRNCPVDIEYQVV